MMDVKISKTTNKSILLDNGFRYRDSGDYRLYISLYKWNGRTTVYGYLYINLDENTFTYDVKSNGTTYYPYYVGDKNHRLNKEINKNLCKEINNLIKKGILVNE